MMDRVAFDGKNRLGIGVHGVDSPTVRIDGWFQINRREAHLYHRRQRFRYLQRMDGCKRMRTSSDSYGSLTQTSIPSGDSSDDLLLPGTKGEGAAKAMHELYLLESRGTRYCVRQHVSSKLAQYSRKKISLAPPVTAAIEALGIREFYFHQQQSLDALKKKAHVIVSTPTASGKSMVFHAPVLDAMAKLKKARALYLMPQKALAQDQLRSMSLLLKEMENFVKNDLEEGRRKKFAHLTGLRACSYDGDTPPEMRSEIRTKASVLVTNPDMLHMAILPHHQMWSSFLGNLAYIVIDEAHVYTGVFGSHFSLVLRRLRRICKVYGSDPRFICCTATIGNPVEHVCRLTGIEEKLWSCISESGAPAGTKTIFIWQPPLATSKAVGQDEGQESRQKSPLNEAAVIISRFMRQGVKLIAFVHARSLAEILTKRVQDNLKDHPGLQSKIEPYRAGYSPMVRREVENRFFKGELLCLAATSALELGIDIGDLDATVHVGMPETINSLWQQAGRAGRREGSESIAVIVTAESPLDQYFLHNPSKLLDRKYELALVNPDNIHVCQMHVSLAAAERPISVPEDSTYFAGVELQNIVDDMQLDGILIERTYSSTSRHYLPSQCTGGQTFTIRGTDSVGSFGKRVQVVDESSGQKIEEIEISRLFVRAHPGAIILHRAETYIVKGINLDSCTAMVTKYNYPHSTFPKENVTVSIDSTLASRTFPFFKLCRGLVKVSHQVVGYSKINVFTEEVLEQATIQTPAQMLHTHAFWIELDVAVQQLLQGKKCDVYEALCSLRNISIALLPSMILSSSEDMGAYVCVKQEPESVARMMIYDHHDGGMGIAEKGFDMFEKLLQDAQKVLTCCGCDTGCFACIATRRSRYVEPDQGHGHAKRSCSCLLDAMLGTWMSEKPTIERDVG